MTIFTETQRFRQWWLWSLLGVVSIVVISSLITHPSAWPYLTVLAGVIILFWVWRLDTRYDGEGVHYQVWPILSWRTIPWTDVAEVTFTTYGFVGYGIRWNFSEWWVYNVAGN